MAAGGEGETARPSEMDRGKVEYNKGNYDAAITAWSRSLKSVKFIKNKELFKTNDAQVREVRDMELKLHVNMAQGYLKLEEWSLAVESAESALGLDSSNTKALYRKAAALMQLKKFVEAEVALEKLLKVEPENAAGKVMLAEARRGGKISEKEAKKQAGKMPSGLEPNTSIEVKTPWVVYLGQGLERIQAFLCSALDLVVSPFRELMEMVLNMLGLGATAVKKEQ